MTLLRQLELLGQQIEQVKAQIQAHIDQHPDLKQQRDLLVSVKGIGALTAAKLLAEFRAITDFSDVRTKLGKYKFFHYHSLLKTVARKEQCSIAQVISKYGMDVKLKQKSGTRKLFGVTYQTKQGAKTLTYFDEPLKKQNQPAPENAAQEVLNITFPLRHRILDRLNANQCELCGYQSDASSEFEVHHVRKLKDIKQKYHKRGKSIPNWVLAMVSLNRKTLVVCKPCHRAIHAGQNTPSIRETG